MASGSLSLRRGPITLIIDLPERLTQGQWDAMGGLVAQLETMEKRLENAYPADQAPEIST